MTNHPKGAHISDSASGGKGESMARESRMLNLAISGNLTKCAVCGMALGHLPDCLHNAQSVTIPIVTPTRIRIYYNASDDPDGVVAVDWGEATTEMNFDDIECEVPLRSVFQDGPQPKFWLEAIGRMVITLDDSRKVRIVK